MSTLVREYKVGQCTVEIHGPGYFDPMSLPPTRRIALRWFGWAWPRRISGGSRCGGGWYRWCGIRWIGRPMPLRWFIWARDIAACAHYTRFRGCGCTVRGKAASERLKQWWRYTYG